jgi:hypothetical protein
MTDFTFIPTTAVVPPTAMASASILPVTTSFLLVALLAVRLRGFKVLSTGGAIIFQGTMLISYALVEIWRFLGAEWTIGSGFVGLLKAFVAIRPSAMIYKSVKHILRDYSAFADLFFRFSGFWVIWELCVLVAVYWIYQKVSTSAGRSELLAIGCIYLAYFFVRSQMNESSEKT